MVQRPEVYQAVFDPDTIVKEKELKNTGFISHSDLRRRLEAADRKKAAEVNA